MQLQIQTDTLDHLCAIRQAPVAYECKNARLRNNEQFALTCEGCMPTLLIQETLFCLQPSLCVVVVMSASGVRGCCGETEGEERAEARAVSSVVGGEALRE